MNTKNTALHSNLAIIGFSALVTLVLGFTLFSGPANAEFAPDPKVLKAIEDSQGLYDSLSEDLSLKSSDYLAKWQVMEDARVARNSVQQSLCAQQIVLAQLKYQATDPSNSEELKRLHDSATEARSCLGIVFP